jgi:choline dehydrogenase-like flavoprotein
MRDALRLASGMPLLVAAGLARLGRRPFLVDHLVMVEQLEQPPDAASRITLTGQRDSFGRPGLRIESGTSEATLRTQRRFHALLAERFARIGVGRLASTVLERPDGEPQFTDAAHPMGSTRMSRSPADGVVDAQCGVHGLDNLYVAGSSVFPTGGHANPTLTLVALSIRLAEHVRARIQGGGPA